MLSLVALAVGGSVLLGAANGAWLQRVSSADHAKQSPFHSPEEQEKAATAGSHLFSNECAKCHGNDGLGKNGRPPVISARIHGTTDGDLFWLMSNGVPWRGMPGWGMLPAQERWQLVTYLRALNSSTTDEPASPEPNAKGK